MVWDVKNQAGVIVLPGQYKVRLKIGAASVTESFNVLIDPRVAEDGVTLADLQEQFAHNMRVRELVTGVNQLVARLREAEKNLSGGPGAGTVVPMILKKLVTEPVRYGKPGLQAQITYLAGMTANVDQKIGRDAIERYEVLRKELDAMRAQADRVLGPTSSAPTERGNGMSPRQRNK
jgi:hypothetical protein